MSDVARALRQAELARMTAHELRQLANELTDRAEAAEAVAEDATSKLMSLQARVVELEDENKTRRDDQVRLNQHACDLGYKLGAKEAELERREATVRYWRDQAELLNEHGAKLAQLLKDAWWVQAAEHLKVVADQVRDIPF